MPESSSNKDSSRRALETARSSPDLEALIRALIEETLPPETREAEQVEKAEANELDREAQAAQVSHIRLNVRRVELEVRKAELENRRLELKNEQISQNRSEREKYAKRIYGIVILWLLCVAAFLFLQGFSSGELALRVFVLPASVLITLLGTTTATVLGIFLIVTRYLFPVPGTRAKPRPPRKLRRPR